MRVKHKAKDLPLKLPDTNTFVITFQLEQKNGQVRVGQTDFIFDPKQAPGLLTDNAPNAGGFQILIDTLSDTIIKLSDLAGEQTNLNSDALKRRAATKITGARRLKLIGV